MATYRSYSKYGSGGDNQAQQQSIYHGGEPQSNVAIMMDGDDEDEAKRYSVPHNTPNYGKVSALQIQSTTDDQNGDDTTIYKAHTNDHHVAIDRKDEYKHSNLSMIQHAKQHDHHNQTHHKKKKTRKLKTSKIEHIDKNKQKVTSQIEIYDEINVDDQDCKSYFADTQKSVHTKQMEFEVDFNDEILQKAKRPFYVLIFISVLFAAVLIMNFIEILKQFEYGGLTPSILACVALIPLFLCFKYFENKIIFQHQIIEKKILETYSLKKKLQKQKDENLQQKKYIEDLKVLIREQEIQIHKLSSRENKLKLNNEISTHQLNLLHGFRKGQMEIQIEFADIAELINMFTIVVSCITLLPFGMTNYRTKLKRILEDKIENNAFLEMHFFFFLLSYMECLDVKRLFRKHKIMRKVQTISDFYDYNHPNSSYYFSDHGSDTQVPSNSAEERPFTPYTPDYALQSARKHSHGGHGHGGDHAQLVNGAKAMGNNTPYNYNQNVDPNNVTMIRPTYNVVDIHRLNLKATEDVIYFKDKDPIKLFRAPLDHFAKPGFTVIVPPELQHRFYDPINGNHCVQQLKVRSIFSSNARPYLIDCYVKNDGINTAAHRKNKKQKHKERDTPISPSPQSHTPNSSVLSPQNPMLLSSSFILKRGDDLRKDQAVLQMFTFMNSLWRENEIKYERKHYVSCLVYKCIPIGNDVGIIEMIANCIELNKIMTLKSSLFTANFCENEKLRNKFHRLIASSAGSFIGSFVCGIRDRHDDNILIDTRKCVLFHIDYGYIFNNKVSLDTAKFAITSDLKKILELYKDGWTDFVELCVQSWMTLRQNASELIDFARVVFAFLYQSNEIEEFLRDSLKLDMKSERAQSYIRNKIQNAPKQWKTKLKNVMHGFAQKMKSTTNTNASASTNINGSSNVHLSANAAKASSTNTAKASKPQGFGIGNLNQSGLGGTKVIL